MIIVNNKRFSVSDFSFVFFILLILIGITVAYLGFSNEIFGKALLGNFNTLILGYLGLIILTYDLRVKREMQKEEQNSRRVIHEAEQAFREKLHQEELNEREEQRKFDKQQQEDLKQISNNIAEKVSNKLLKDNNWAIEALERAKLGMRGQSLFADRLNHFREEKEHIAREFTPLLLDRCKNQIEKNGKKVFLVIDSGTTLFSFFEYLGKLTVKIKQNGETWLNKLTIVTNNLSGLETLIETGRINPNNRYSDLAIQCHLLPGMPLPIYSAVIGEKTEEALKSLRASAVDNNEDPVFIGLITGNWIRLRRTPPVCPIPLARGDVNLGNENFKGNGHLGFKNILVANSDEVFVISPLGKIFVEVAPEEINEALNLKIQNKDPDGQPYSGVTIGNDKAKYVKLISTRRIHSNNILQRHSNRISDILGVEDYIKACNSFIDADIVEISHMLFQFDYQQENSAFEREKEFPHLPTRNEEFTKRFFQYPNPN